MAKLVPITSDNYDSAYYVNFDTMMGYIADEPKKEEKETIDAAPQPVPIFEDKVTEDRDDLSDFTGDVEFFTVEDFSAEEGIKTLKKDRVPSYITQKNLTGGSIAAQGLLTGTIDPILSFGAPALAKTLTGKIQNDVLGIKGLNSYRPDGILGSAWDLSMRVHANNIAATGEYIKVNGNIVTWNDNTFGFKGMRTYTGNHGGLSAGQLDGIVAAQKRTDIGEGVGIAYSAGQYRADKEDRKQAGAGLTGDVLAIDIVDPRVISGSGKTTVYMKANGVFVDATGRRLQSASLGGAAAKRLEELGLKNFRDSLTSGASSMLGTRRVDDMMRTSFQGQLDTYAKSIRSMGAKYDSSNQFSSDTVGKILDRSSLGISSNLEDLKKYKANTPKPSTPANNVRDDGNSTRGTTSSGYSGSTIRQQQEASDKAMADFYGASSKSNPFSASRKNQPTSQSDFEARMRQAGALPTIEVAYGGSLQKLAPGGDVNSGANFTGPVGFVGNTPENVPNDKTVADDVLTKLPNEGFVINAPAVEIEGSRDIKNMIVDAIKYARQNSIFVPDMPVQTIDVAISKGEVVIPPELKRIIGEDRLTKINNRGKREVARRQQEAEVKAAEGGFIKKKLNVGGTVNAADQINKIPTPTSSAVPIPKPDVFVDTVGPTELPEVRKVLQEQGLNSLEDLEYAIKYGEIGTAGKEYEENPYRFHKVTGSSAFGPAGLLYGTIELLKKKNLFPDDKDLNDYVDILINQGKEKYNIQVKKKRSNRFPNVPNSQFANASEGIIPRELHEKFYPIVSRVYFSQIMSQNPKTFEEFLKIHHSGGKVKKGKAEEFKKFKQRVADGIKIRRKLKKEDQYDTEKGFSDLTFDEYLRTRPLDPDKPSPRPEMDKPKKDKPKTIFGIPIPFLN